MYRLIAIIWLVTGLTAIGFAAEPVIISSDYAELGEILRIILDGKSVDSVSVSLLDNRGSAVSRAQGFQWSAPSGKSHTIILLGIPSSLSAGNYKLLALAQEGRAEWQIEKRITVRERLFPEQVIKLSDKMNEIYTDNSQRKKFEAKAFWAVLNAFDPDAVHHTGSLSLPVDSPVVTSAFGDRRRYRMPDGSETASIHFGQDLWAEKGTPVTSAARGRVVMATERFLTGNTIILEHLPGVYTLYYHLDSISVYPGEFVEQGTIIGTLGETGFVTGEHLHWELRSGAVPVESEYFLTSPLLDTDWLISNMD